MNNKKIDVLHKKLGWYVAANDQAGFLQTIDTIYKEEAARLQDAPEPYKTNILDNLQFQKFALFNTDNELVKAAREMAENLSSVLAGALVIDDQEEGSIDQANNVLQQYFFEQLARGVVFIDGTGTEHTDWRNMIRG